MPTRAHYKTNDLIDIFNFEKIENCNATFGGCPQREVAKEVCFKAPPLARLRIKMACKRKSFDEDLRIIKLYGFQDKGLQLMYRTGEVTLLNNSRGCTTEQQENSVR
eukprot:gnl/MRDRNA2_/MRDRNA2_117216_c0_seq1.p1 gnl/MRDRNA2_/MRDRNA2_117216_c0~~gnl/MRDRNA2_/MRDRNA2_117216_c0_seq1.p1  ORF type:complete len:107 (+),score=14.66 gnl/MRDRNA2_/MRDRNA2_117216_c0_seq1:152-472(+)